MPTPKELETKIKRLRWPGLKNLWSAIKKGDTPGWEAGKAFEYLVLRAFELEHTTREPVSVRYPYSVTLFDEKVEEIEVKIVKLAIAEEGEEIGITMRRARK